MTIEIDRAALAIADHAYLETQGSNAQKVEAAIWAYLWAGQNVKQMFGMAVFPSLNELREAMANR